MSDTDDTTMPDTDVRDDGTRVESSEMTGPLPRAGHTQEQRPRTRVVTTNSTNSPFHSIFNGRTIPDADFKNGFLNQEVSSDAITTNRPGTKSHERKRSETATKKQAHGRLPLMSKMSKSEEKAFLESFRRRAPVEVQDDTASAVSTNAESKDSVFSSESLGTSASSLYEESGFSAHQIQSATRVFVSTLQYDELLAPLYESMRKNSRVGPDRLHKQLSEAIRVYAKQLKEEAKDHHQHAASRLVRQNAHYAARCIASGDDPKYRLQVSKTQEEQDSRDVEDSSEGEAAYRQGDETDFGGLEAFRLFLIDSEAHATFRAHVQALWPRNSTASESMPVVPTQTVSPPPQPSTPVANINLEETIRPHTESGTLGTLVMQLFKKTTAFMVVNVLIPMGFLEPPLKTGWTRIMVECHTCGERCFDDVSLNSEGEVTTLTEQMQRTSSAEITVSASGAGHPPRGSSFQCPLWLYNTYCKVVTRLGWRKMILPVARDPQTDCAPSALNGRTTSEGTLHLMGCIHRNWHSMSLLQNRVEHIRNDRDLVYLLKELVLLRRGRIARVLSCRSIRAVHFTKFVLHIGESLEVRHHEICCKDLDLDCGCNPPFSKLKEPDPEYACASTPSSWPQKVPTYFGHLLKHPGSVDKRRTGILAMIPKRRLGQLVVDYPKEESTEGWGLYFEEDWEPKDIIVLAIIAFIPSLVFLIVWPIERSDLSAASGVAAYIVGVIVLFSSLIVIRTGTT